MTKIVKTKIKYKTNFISRSKYKSKTDLSQYNFVSDFWIQEDDITIIMFMLNAVSKGYSNLSHLMNYRPKIITDDSMGYNIFLSIINILIHLKEKKYLNSDNFSGSQDCTYNELNYSKPKTKQKSEKSN